MRCAILVINRAMKSSPIGADSPESDFANNFHMEQEYLKPMLTLDPRSIIFVTALMAFMFFLILFGLNRSLPKQLPGLREGVLCAFAWFVGIGEILLRGVIPDWLSIIGGNTAITLGIVEIYAYLHLSAGRAVSARRLLWLAGVISLAALAALTYYGRYSYILTFTSGSNAVMLGACAVQSFLLPRSCPAERFTSTSLSCASLISLARFLVSALGVETVLGAFDPTMFQKAYFSLIGCSIIAILTGVTLTTYDRLRALLADANRSLELQCSGLICADTSVGGKSTTRGKANDKATQTFRHQLEAGGRSYDQGTGSERKPGQPEYEYWRDCHPALAQAV